MWVCVVTLCSRSVGWLGDAFLGNKNKVLSPAQLSIANTIPNSGQESIAKVSFAFDERGARANIYGAPSQNAVVYSFDFGRYGSG